MTLDALCIWAYRYQFDPLSQRMNKISGPSHLRAGASLARARGLRSAHLRQPGHVRPVVQTGSRKCSKQIGNPGSEMAIQMAGSDEIKSIKDY
jgi:hypothetical protein